MSSGGTGQPKRPPGPPPSGPQPTLDVSGGQTIRGIGDVKRPPGPPPGAPPITSLKPPPLAPPPRAAMTTSQRPPIESIKAIETPIGDSLRGGPPSLQSSRPSTSNLSGRGPPPRALGPEFSATSELDSDMKTIKKEVASSRIVINQSGGEKKGAIAMFEEPPPQEPAEKKAKTSGGDGAVSADATPPGSAAAVQQANRGPRPGPGPPPPRPGQAPTDPMVRVPRPLPPGKLAPGIPDGQPFPPNFRPPNESKAPAPVRPPPDRNRAPPHGDPDAPKIIPAPAPPNEQAPYNKGKKVIEEEFVYVKRRERDMPEFESSSDEEVEKEDFKKRSVKQPAGLPRGELPPPRTGDEADDDDKSGLPKGQILGQPTSKMAPKPATIPATPSAPAVAASATAATIAATKGSPSKADASKTLSKADSKPPITVDDDEVTKSIKTGPLGPSDTSVADTFETSSHVRKIDINEAKAAQAKADIEALNARAAEEYLPPISSTNDEVEPSEFVAPPSSAYNFSVDDSAFARSLPRGRLSVKCIEGFGIKRKNDTNTHPRTDPFLKLKLGVADRLPWKSTEVQRKQTDCPTFGDEIVFFDITHPGFFVFQDDLQLIVEVWNRSTLKDEIMGNVSISVVRFLKDPYFSFEELIPLQVGNRKTNSKIKLEFVFEEARSGMFSFTLFEARGLRNVDAMGQQNPYVQLQLGQSLVKRTKTAKNGGTDPYFTEEEVLMWVDQENWVNDLQINLLDDLLGMEKPIGYTHFSLLPYMKSRPEDAKEDVFDLFYMTVDPKDDREKKEVAFGELVMRVKYYPAGKLMVLVDKANNLRFPENYQPPSGDLTRLDPFASLTLDGLCAKVIKRTPADKDGGAAPVWSNLIHIDIVDQYQIMLEVYHHSGHGSDVLLGTAEISLLTVFRNGHTSFWTALKQKKANGGIREGGEIFLDLKFVGPVGISFPQCRPEIDSFDDTIRQEIRPDFSKEEVEEVTKPIISTIPLTEKEMELERIKKDKEVEKEKKAKKAGLAPPPSAIESVVGPEFTEEEVIAAFKFIDLDHNNYIGAAEIRHILVCMGEMITDEEIDMMISMVDMDGDGQVSLQEFRALVMHPNPSEIDLHKEVNAARDDDIMKDKQALAGKSVGIDLKAFQRQKELTAREKKKKVLTTFVFDNLADFNYVKASYANYLMIPLEKRPGGRIRFDEFVKALNIDPITEYRNMHALFDSEELGDVDFREILLSMMNFIEIDREMRIRFTFTMYDELKTGYITKKEVEEILKGNHMISLSSVQRKAETIMKQAAANSAGAITMNEFVVISKKFPNILLPAVGAAGPTVKK